MKQIVLLLIAIMWANASSYAQSAVTGSRSVGSFHSIQVASGIDAELVLSAEESVEFELKGAESGQLITEVEEGVLKVRMKTGNYRDADLKVKLHFKELKSIEATGRASIWSYEDLYPGDIGIRLFNGGAVRLELYCDTLTVNISQGSILTLVGEAVRAGIKVNTNATFNGYEFRCEDVEVAASGTGKAKVSVSNTLKASATTGGFVGYVGNPRRVDRKASLKGEILETELEE